MQHEKRRKPLKILDSRLYMWYFEIKEKCVEKNQMLNDKICKLREKLNESIINGEDYSIIYQLSIELDELIAQYYEILTKNS